MATKGEITLIESRCLGCGYCAIFCKQGCITWPSDKYTPQGYLLPVISNPSRCTACGNCGFMCPHSAIEVYQILEQNPG